VFVDVDPKTHNIDASKIEAAISSKTKAIMLAHSHGNPFNLDMFTALCKRHNQWLVENYCDALGTTYRGQMVGTFGDIGKLSFYPAHYITMGEGGAVFTNSKNLKPSPKVFVIGGVTVSVPPAKTTPAANAFALNRDNYPKAMTTNIPTVTWAIT
jgi:CDP-6-deoxy-D-xylo-4-hexulose-3-dehydrase